VITEADTCRKYVLPKLYESGWIDDQISEQKTFTDGRIVVVSDKVLRRPQNRADYLLRYTRDFMLAVVEAKPAYAIPGAGLQQAKEYAQILGLKFAYATNGHGIVEHDFLTGRDRDLATFPAPSALWARLRRAEGFEAPEVAERLLTPSYHLSGKSPPRADGRERPLCHLRADLPSVDCLAISADTAEDCVLDLIQVRSGPA